jgi:hypothetical protein
MVCLDISFCPLRVGTRQNHARIPGMGGLFHDEFMHNHHPQETTSLSFSFWPNVNVSFAWVNKGIYGKCILTEWKSIIIGDRCRWLVFMCLFFFPVDYCKGSVNWFCTLACFLEGLFSKAFKYLGNPRFFHWVPIKWFFFLFVLGI